MSNSIVTARRVAAIACLLLAASLLSGCGLFVTFYAGRFTDRPDKKPGAFNATKDEFLIEMADRFGLMALFSEVVYRRDLAVAVRDAEGCDYLKRTDLAQDRLDFGMPKGDVQQGRWMRWIPQSTLHRELACVNSGGLYYETYVHVDKDQRIDEAVIAFRGSEMRSGQAWPDWLNNAKAFFGFEPDQYTDASVKVLQLIEALEPALKRTPGGELSKIYAVGHSLGGGLAQQAGYLSPRIAEVYAFNTSPVTNWSWLQIDGRVKQHFPIIHRVSNGGEILEKLRFVTTTVTEARYGRHDVALQLGEKASIDGHDMKIITCTFAELIALREDPGTARHHYPVNYARKTVLNQDRNATPEELLRRVCLRE